MSMAKSAVKFAIKHQISLGRDADGYHIRNPETRQIVAVSNKDTANSAICMMQRYISRPEHLRNWR